jgi:hypothetical protein
VAMGGQGEAARGGASAHLDTSLTTILSAEETGSMATAGDSLDIHDAQGVAELQLQAEDRATPLPPLRQGLTVFGPRSLIRGCRHAIG